MPPAAAAALTAAFGGGDTAAMVVVALVGEGGAVSLATPAATASPAAPTAVAAAESGACPFTATLTPLDGLDWCPLPAAGAAAAAALAAAWFPATAARVTAAAAALANAAAGGAAGAGAGNSGGGGGDGGGRDQLAPAHATAAAGWPWSRPRRWPLPALAGVAALLAALPAVAAVPAARAVVFLDASPAAAAAGAASAVPQGEWGGRGGDGGPGRDARTFGHTALRRGLLVDVVAVVADEDREGWGTDTSATGSSSPPSSTASGAYLSLLADVAAATGGTFLPLLGSPCSGDPSDAATPAAAHPRPPWASLVAHLATPTLLRAAVTVRTPPHLAAAAPAHPAACADGDSGGGGAAAVVAAASPATTFVVALSHGGGGGDGDGLPAVAQAAARGVAFPGLGGGGLGGVLRVHTLCLRTSPAAGQVRGGAAGGALAVAVAAGLAAARGGRGPHLPTAGWAALVDTLCHAVPPPLRRMWGALAAAAGRPPTPPPVAAACRVGEWVGELTAAAAVAADTPPPEPGVWAADEALADAVTAALLPPLRELPAVMAGVVGGPLGRGAAELPVWGVPPAPAPWPREGGGIVVATGAATPAFATAAVAGGLCASGAVPAVGVALAAAWAAGLPPAALVVAAVPCLYTLSADESAGGSGSSTPPRRVATVARPLVHPEKMVGKGGIPVAAVGAIATPADDCAYLLDAGLLLMAWTPSYASAATAAAATAEAVVTATIRLHRRLRRGRRWAPPIIDVTLHGEAGLATFWAVVASVAGGGHPVRVGAYWEGVRAGLVRGGWLSEGVRR